MALKRIEQRREKRKKAIIGIIISLLMVLSGFGIFLSGRGSTQNSTTDNGLRFSITYDTETYPGYRIPSYTTKIAGQETTFNYLPSQVEYYPLDEATLPILREANAIVLSFDPTTDPYNLQVIDLVRYDLSTWLDKPFINAITQEDPYYNLPIATCANATANLPIITFVVDDEPSITREDNCISIHGNNTKLIEARDRLTYAYYGIYEE